MEGLFDTHHGQRRPLEPWEGNYGQNLLLRYTEPATCSFWGLTHFRVGTSRLHDDAGVEYYIVELVRCGLFGSTGTACTGSRACRERRIFVAKQFWRSEMVPFFTTTFFF